jgi:hypothetical protein
MRRPTVLFASRRELILFDHSAAARSRRVSSPLASQLFPRRASAPRERRVRQKTEATARPRACAIVDADREPSDELAVEAAYADGVRSSI